MSRIYLAHSTSSLPTYKTLDWKEYPASLLVSYCYLDNYRLAMKYYEPPFTMLDSGAFSAWKSGYKIDIDALIEETKNPYWTECVALDVVGDPEGSLKNAVYMKEHGSRAFPVFHIGEPLEVLDEYCKQFPKVGLSCRFGESVKQSFHFLDQCFHRAWPHRFHSFGWVDRRMLRRYPFHSADTSSWVVAPRAWGRWRVFGQMSVRSYQTNLTAEIDWYLKMQRFLEFRWRDQLAALETLEGP